ncbi:alpha/beta hydrolase [Nocardia sp. NPDC050378]|uniref:alpha/beta fold hydrolase n=1 Tax=Nocardia sp. NPDC050378 TaxID=3155400 RepID=UPI0033F2DE28
MATGPDDVVVIPGGELAYWDTGGTGPVVVALHPATGTAATWAPQRAPLADAGFRLVAYSRRGYLGSTPVDPGNPVSAAADLAALVEALDLDRIHLVGAAMGGIYALDFALTFPEVVHSLTAVGSMLGIVDESWRTALARVGLPGSAQLPPEFRELGPSYRAENPDGVESWLRIARSAHPGGLHLQPTAGEITWSTLRELRAPTLLVGGGADLLAPAPLLEQAAARLPQGRYAHVPDAGHAIAWERPDEFNRALLGFLRAG